MVLCLTPTREGGLIEVADWMDQLIAEAERQGFTVHQHSSSDWRFQRGQLTVLVPQPRSVADLVRLIETLRGMGLHLPDQ